MEPPLSSFVQRNCFREIERILTIVNEETERPLLPVPIDLLCLFDHDPEMALNLLVKPKEPWILTKELSEAFDRAQLANISLFPDAKLKSKLEFNLKSLPLAEDFTRYCAPKSSDIGSWISFIGTVIRIGSVQTKERSRTYECALCKVQTKSAMDEWQYGLMDKPIICNSVDEDDVRCHSNKFKLVSNIDPNDLDNVQEIKVQELTEKLNLGKVPKSVCVILKNELIDKCMAGDKIIVCGCLIARWRPIKANQMMSSELCIVASSVLPVYQRINSLISSNDEDNPVKEFWKNFGTIPSIEGRNVLVNSFCPEIYDLEIVKLCLILTLLSGSDGDSGRKNIHILLVGDSGTSKSHLIYALSKILPRSIFTTGSGTTGAGLTVAAVKDPNGSMGGEWTIEPGALPLADGGICCIDEFMAIKSSDKMAIHEAMEQQTISVAKAGIVCKVNTRCSIIAACNGNQINEDEKISSSVALSSPLLSRFDLILALTNKNSFGSDDWDERLSNSILETKIKGSESSFNFDLKKYLGIAKKLLPKITQASQKVLLKYYEIQRGNEFRESARTTARLLESLIRITEAHAKLMGRSNWAQLEDAVWAVWLIDISLPSQVIFSTAKFNLLNHSLPNSESLLKEVAGRLKLSILVLNELENEEISGNQIPAEIDFKSSQMVC
jgi:DNA helicase MCM9